MFIWLVTFDGPGEEYVGMWPIRAVVVASSEGEARELARSQFIPRPGVESALRVGRLEGPILTYGTKILCTEENETR